MLCDFLANRANSQNYNYFPSKWSKVAIFSENSHFKKIAQHQLHSSQFEYKSRDQTATTQLLEKMQTTLWYLRQSETKSRFRCQIFRKLASIFKLRFRQMVFGYLVSVYSLNLWSLGGFICTFSLLISLSITLRTSKFRNQFTNQFKIF